MVDLPILKIFLSSPGDVAEERALAEIVFRRIAAEVADVVRLQIILWEHEPLFAHADFMAQMPRPSQCDLVVTILWSRLGTRLPADYAEEPGKEPPTGTEWEVSDALKAYAATKEKPSLLIYRRMPGPLVGLGSTDYEERNRQWAQLEDFCRRVFFDAHGAITVAHHTFSDGHDFERLLSDHVRGWLNRQVHGGSADAAPVWHGRSPFRGLEPFEAEHKAVFFGRAEALSALIGRIRQAEMHANSGATARFLLVQGISGGGKTSLFKAGLLPLLELRPIEGIAIWRVAAIRPSDSDPALKQWGSLAILASRIADTLPALARLGTPAQKLAELFWDRPEEATGRIETCLAAEAEAGGASLTSARLLIYVDQLEEVFAASSEEATRLLRVLATLARSDAIWVAATLRSDFAHRLEAYPELAQCLAQTPPYTLLPPQPDEFAEMIQEPARAAGLIWEKRDGISLDQALLRDAAANPEGLPLLEYTLTELYEQRDGRLLRWSSYGGGLQQALISAANDSVTAAAIDDRMVFRDVMRELVGVGADGVATRRYASLSRFPSGTPARALLDEFVKRRLCVTVDEGRGDGPVTRLAHEALVRAWPLAQGWLKQEMLLLQVRDEIARDADAWNRHGRKDGWLGIAPEKIAAIQQIEREGLLPADPAPQYAERSKQRAARTSLLKRAAVGVICILALIAGVAWWVAARQRNLAQIQAQTADRATAFMVSLFQVADPTENQGNAVTAKELLKRGAEEIGKSDSASPLSHEPRVRAALQTSMGEAYSGLGLYKESEDLLKGALADEQRAGVVGEPRARTLIAYGTALYLAGEYEAAEKPLREAVALAAQSSDAASTLSSQARTGLADVLVQLGKFPDAIALDREALAADRQRSPPDNATLSNTLSSLGAAYYYSGDLQAAEAPMREAVSLRQTVYGMQDARTAEALNNLGALLYDSGKSEESIVEYQKALQIQRRVYGESHPEIATTLSNIGRSELMSGHLDKAEPLMRQALKMTEEFEGDTHDYLVSPLNSLAMIDAYQGHLDQAKKEIGRAEAIARLPDHGDLLDQVLLNAADLEISSGNLTHAQALLGEAKTALEAAHPPSGATAWRYAVWDSVSARIRGAQGDKVGAERTLTDAIEILRHRFGPTGFYTARAERAVQELKNATPHG
jgi:tetratricopeptide (TPR) repeat protein